MTSQRIGAVRGDVFGGLTAGVVALPLALAFGVASGVGAAAGLYGAIALGLVAALAGGTRTQVSGPTGPMTVITASAVAAFGGSIPDLIMVVLMAGALQVLFGVLKLGRFVKYIPYPVISGFMSGIGAIIILLQLPVLFGGPGAPSPMAAIFALPPVLAHPLWPSMILGALSLAVVFLTPARISSVLPSPLIALVAGTALAWGMGLDAPTIGAIPSGLPELHLPALDPAKWTRMASLALALAALGCIDTLLTSIVADSLTRTRHNSDRELIGQGLGNMAAGLFGGLAGAGATMRTVVNIKAGGSTRLSGVIHALFLLAVLLGLGPLCSHIPLAVLAGILIKVGVDILDYRLIKGAAKAPRTDLAVMLAVFATTVFVDLIVAVALGVTLASFMLTLRMARQTRIMIEETPEDENMAAVERGLQQESDYRLRVLNVSGPFFFGTTAQMQDKIGALLGARVAVINCLDVPFLDLTAAFTLCEAAQRLKDGGIEVLLAVKPEHRRTLAAMGCDAILEECRMFDDQSRALAAARTMLAPKPGIMAAPEIGTA